MNDARQRIGYAWRMFWFLFACPTPSPPNASSRASTELQAQLASRPLQLTRHGRCRMACRGIDQDEVEAVLRSGTLEPGRSRNDGACPTHAFAGKGSDGAHLRVVFAACPDVTKVVTTIDLDRDPPCACD